MRPPSRTPQRRPTRSADARLYWKKSRRLLRLERRPQLGHDVFACGQPEIFGNAVEAGQAIDIVEFLWASLALFDDETAVDTTEVYRARRFALYAVAEARERILRLLAETPE
jgi:segregation and condensation protein A